MAFTFHESAKMPHLELLINIVKKTFEFMWLKIVFFGFWYICFHTTLSNLENFFIVRVFSMILVCEGHIGLKILSY